MAVECGDYGRPSTSAGSKMHAPLRTKTFAKDARAQDLETILKTKKTSKSKSTTKPKKQRKKQDGTHQLTSLLSSESENICNQLLIASEKGNYKAAFLLLHQGVDKDRCKGLLGYSPLHHAAARGHLNVVQLLLDFGWSANVQNEAVETPLHLACFDGHVHVAELLLDRGADINAQTREQESPLFYAARKGHYRVVRLLVRRECSLSAANCYGDIAEDEARGEKTLAEFAVGGEDLQRASERSGRGGADSIADATRAGAVLLGPEKPGARLTRVVPVASGGG